MLVDEIIAGNARRRPGAIGWRFGERALSWREIDERVNRIANALLALGLASGDRVALLSENSHQLAELYFAIPRAGLIVVPINPLSVRREIEFILGDVGARALLVSGRFVDRLQPVGELAASVEHVLGIEAAAALAETIEHRLAAAPATPPPVRTTQDSVRAIKYTSGTTGTPKGCISTQHQFLINIINYLVQMPFTQEDRCLLCLPMTAGVGIAMLTAYSYLGLETEILPRFNAGQVLDTIAQRRISRFFAVPTLLAALADEQAARPRDLSSLRLIGYGGQAAATSLVLRVMDVLGCGLYQVFGASEAGGFISYLMPEDHERLRDGHHSRIDSMGRRIVPCGREVQAFHLRIVDASRNELPNGEVGELAVFGDSNMSGYWNRPEQSAEVLAGGWLYTGDLALRDDDGLIYIVDRKRDMIVSGGLNVYSAEVEAVLTEHAAIAEIAVIGVPDPYWGERVQAYVVLREGWSVTEEMLLAFAAERLAAYKRPKRFVFVASLPKTSSGKLRKVELREMR
jgi:acyl-CoA synthetase (AMP-forming)/AMP-acid ligase II